MLRTKGLSRLELLFLKHEKSEKNQRLPDRTFPEYFTELAANYARSTGNSTYKVIEKILQDVQPPIVDLNSIVNDNACGPGVATATIVAHLGAEPRLIEANDSVPAMVDALAHRVRTLGWKQVRASLIDSHDLAFPDNTFTTSISNISITTYKDTLKCLQEMHRTLKPGGRAVITIWKRFGIANMIHAAQRLVREDSEPMGIPKNEFMQEGYLQNFVK